MEQTAVKKLELKLLGIISFDSEELRKKYKDAINQAKAMEKEQIKNSYHSGAIDGFNFRTTSISPNSEEYYNENFKSE